MAVMEVRGVLDPASAVTELRLSDGTAVRLSTAALLQSAVPAPRPVVSPEEPETVPVEWTAGLDPVADEAVVIPIAEEQLHVGKEVVETGKVRLRKTVQEYETALDEMLAVRSYDVERIVLNQPVESAPPTRQEGDTTIYSLVEEQLVLTRQLVLKEELRVTRRDTERHDTQPVTLRREVLEVEREPLRRDR